jgi:hypothetical protein
MRAVVDGLKQQVDAQQEQIEHQSGLLQDAQKVVREQKQEQQEKGALSGMSEFWQAIDVNMSVAGSYAYNFNNPTNTPASSGAGQNSGNSGLFYPFHPDHNSFQVDQVWFDIGKVTTAESRAGFHTTILYGTTATFLGQGSPAFGRANNDSTSDYYVHQAYVNYLAPVGEGVQFTFGKFATPIGAEVADASKNWAITRGDVYNLLEPIDHLGLMASTTVGPLTFAAAVVNEISLGASSPDVNSEKSYLGKVAIGNDMVSLATTVGYGAEGPASPFTTHNNSTRQGIVNVLGNFNSDAFSAYVNADYVWVEGQAPSAWGVSVAGKVPITDLLFAALRLEYVRDKSTGGSALGTFDTPSDFFGIGTPFNHSEVYGATGTIGYEIAENLTLKGEVRWDRVVEETYGGLCSLGGGCVVPREFLTNTSRGSNDQVVGLGQIVYAF